MRLLKKGDLDSAAGWAERRGAMQEEERGQEETREIQEADRERERQRQLVATRRAVRESGSNRPRDVIVEVFTLEYDAFFDYGALNPNPEVHVDAWDDKLVDFFSEGEHIGRLTILGLLWVVEAFTESGLETIRKMLFDEGELEEIKPMRL